MGIINQGLLGPVSGKVGNVVGASWKGIDYLRIMPASVTNPRTEGQLKQRSKFLVIIRFLQPLIDFIRIGFKGYARKMSAYNAAMSYNLSNAVTGEFPDYDIDFSKVLISRGTLRPAAMVELSSTQPAALVVQWENNSGLGNAMPHDKAIVVIYNTDKMDVRYLLNEATRENEQTTVELPESYIGDNVHVFLTFTLLNDMIATGNKNTISNRDILISRIRFNLMPKWSNTKPNNNNEEKKI